MKQLFQVTNATAKKAKILADQIDKDIQILNEMSDLDDKNKRMIIRLVDLIRRLYGLLKQLKAIKGKHVSDDGQSGNNGQ